MDTTRRCEGAKRVENRQRGKVATARLGKGSLSAKKALKKGITGALSAHGRLQPRGRNVSSERAEGDNLKGSRKGKAKTKP